MNTLVTLDCKHVLRFGHNVQPPRPGDIVYCIKCNDAREVEYAPEEYRTRCTMCTWGKYHGRAALRAGIDAAKHANKRGHVVKVMNGMRVERLIGEGQRSLLPGPSDAPPY